MKNSSIVSRAGFVSWMSASMTQLPFNSTLVDISSFLAFFAFSWSTDVVFTERVRSEMQATVTLVTRERHMADVLIDNLLYDTLNTRMFRF